MQVCSQTRNSAFLSLTVSFATPLPAGSSLSEIIGNSGSDFMSGAAAGSRYPGGVVDGDL